MPTPTRQHVETIDIERLNSEWNTLKPPAEQDRWAAEYSRMIRHTQGQAEHAIITARRPYEPEEVKKYRVKSFRAITKSSFNRALNALQRLMSQANVDVDIPEAAEEFLSARKFDDASFLDYINKSVIRRMIEDPNGLLVWWAEYPGDDATTVEPQPILLLSKRILALTDELLVFEADERSPVTVLDGRKRREVMEGRVYYIITKAGYYRRVQYGEKGKPKFRIEPGLRHGLGYLPFVTLGGEEVMIADEIENTPVRYLASYFAPPTEFADEALHQFSDWQAVMVSSAHPIREMEPQKCPGQDCVKGKIRPVDGQVGPLVTCSVCNGAGEILPESPYGTILRRARRSGLEEKPTDPVPAVRYLHADPSILEQIGKEWRKLLEDVDKALNLLFVEEAQSGVAKEIDREDKVSTMDRIGNNVWKVITANSLEIILALRRVSEEARITLPSTFIVRTEEDLREELTTLVGDGVLPLYRAEAMMELLRKRFPGNARLIKAAEVLAYYDKAFGYNASEKAAFVAQNLLNDEIVRKSVLATAAINRISMDMGDKFVDADRSVILAALEKEVAKEMAENPVIPANDDLDDPTE